MNGKTLSSVGALPSWKYGAESVSPRSAGVSHAHEGRGSPCRSSCATSGHGPEVTQVPTSCRRTPPLVTDETTGPPSVRSEFPLPESVFAGPAWQVGEAACRKILLPWEWKRG